MNPEAAAVDALVVGGRLLIAGVLLRAALGKARSPAGAIDAVGVLLGQRHRMLASIIVWCVVSVEIAVGYALMAGVALSAAAGAVIVMMVGFSVASFGLRQRGAEGCSCFGDETKPAGHMMLARNWLLTVGAAAIVLASAIDSGAGANRSAWSLAPDHLLWGMLLAVSGWLCWTLLSAVDAALRPGA